MERDLGDPSQSVVWITGGTRGLGANISARLAPRYHLALSYRTNERAAADVAERCRRDVGRSPLLLRGDLAAEQVAAEQLRSVIEHYGRLDALVHCVALATFKPLLEMKPRELRRVLGYSFESFHQVVLAAAEPLKATRGCMVVVSSSGARRTMPGYGGLGAAKAALESYARHLAVELGPHEVRVNMVSPGLLKTASLPWLGIDQKHINAVEARTPLGRLVTTEEVAAVVEFLISPGASGITGQLMVIDGGYEVVV